jgi:lysophospholipase L1-like esterase
MDVPINDFYSLLVDKLKLARGDRFHWKREAYDLLAKKVVASIERELAQGPASNN